MRLNETQTLTKNNEVMNGNVKMKHRLIAALKWHFRALAGKEGSCDMLFAYILLFFGLWALLIEIFGLSQLIQLLKN